MPKSVSIDVRVNCVQRQIDLQFNPVRVEQIVVVVANILNNLGDVYGSKLCLNLPALSLNRLVQSFQLKKLARAGKRSQNIAYFVSDFRAQLVLGSFAFQRRMPRQRIAAGVSRRIGDGAVFLAAKAAAEEAPERLGDKRQRCFLRRLSPPSRLGDARAGIPAGGYALPRHPPLKREPNTMR